MERRIITENEFWITNITKLNVSLSDLQIYIGPYKSMNLLDKRHHNYTKEQLEKSSISGSLKEKSNKIKIRKVVPDISIIVPGTYESKQPALVVKLRSRVILEEPHYEELQISEEEFADKMSEED